MRALVIFAAMAMMAVPALAAPAPERVPVESPAAWETGGAKISAQWCDRCHMVRESGSDVAPPFAVIGAKRNPDEVRAFLAKPHGGMEPIELSNEQIRDIIAYMRSLVPAE